MIDMIIGLAIGVVMGVLFMAMIAVGATGDTPAPPPQEGEE